MLDTINMYWFWHSSYETATHKRMMERWIFTINTINFLLSRLLSCAWARVAWLGPSQGCVWTLDFSAHTQNGQSADCEEIFVEFDKKCIGLELQTTPLTVKVLVVLLKWIILNSLHINYSCNVFLMKNTFFKLSCFTVQTQTPSRSFSVWGHAPQTLQHRSFVSHSVGCNIVSCAFWQLKKEQNLNFPLSSSAARIHSYKQCLYEKTGISVMATSVLSALVSRMKKHQ